MRNQVMSTTKQPVWFSDYAFVNSKLTHPLPVPAIWQRFLSQGKR